MPACFFFYLQQCINIPGIQYHRLFTNHIRPNAQAKTNMGIMQVIGAAHRYIINRCSASAQLFAMPVKAFKFGKKMRPRKILVQHSHRIMRIQGRQQVIPGILYGFQMPGGNITRRTYENEIFQGRVEG